MIIMSALMTFVWWLIKTIWRRQKCRYAGKTLLYLTENSTKTIYVMPTARSLSSQSTFIEVHLHLVPVRLSTVFFA